MSTAPLQQALIFDQTGAAKGRLLSRRGEPLFYANWDNILFIHYETEADRLQRRIPRSGYQHRRIEQQEMRSRQRGRAHLLPCRLLQHEPTLAVRNPAETPERINLEEQPMLCNPNGARSVVLGVI